MAAPDHASSVVVDTYDCDLEKNTAMADPNGTTAPTDLDEPTVARSVWSMVRAQLARSKPPRTFARLARTPDDRLRAFVPDTCPDTPLLARDWPAPASPTVLYLAYGSNMAAATFQGARGIRPLSAVPVAVPTLALTFDLPGLPYTEPCFANTALRKAKLPPVPFPPSASSSPSTSAPSQKYRPAWDGPLYGVVYEVTAADYAHIIATEGGGSSYQEIVVPCLAQPPRIGVPERKPHLPDAFMARTLWAPQTQLGDAPGNSSDDPSDNDNSDNDDGDDRSRLRKAWDALIAKGLRFAGAGVRPDPDYAQPSARYLGLLTTGAADHELPDAYQAWLASCEPYTRTTRGQNVASILLLLLIGPPFVLLLLASKPFMDADGRSPRWAQATHGLLIHVAWVLHDRLLRPVFGDGEHTIDGEQSATEPDAKATEETPLISHHAK